MSQIVVPRWLIAVGMLFVLLGLMAFVASLVVGYIGDEYVSPPFSEQSVPSPRR
jgi:hypothetical protein